MIPPQEPYLQASSSPIPGIRIWCVELYKCANSLPVNAIYSNHDNALIDFKYHKLYQLYHKRKQTIFFSQ